MRLLVGLAMLVLAGCGGVVSEHPASEPADTRLDERLIGLWRIDREASGETDKDAKGEGIVAIGKTPGPTPGLEFALLLLESDGELQFVRDGLRATTIGGKPYVSLHVAAEKANPDSRAKPDEAKEGWVIFRYDLSQDGVLRVLGMDVPTVAKDVKEEKIAGIAPTPEPNAPPDSVTVKLSASTSALRAWLESRGEALFKADKPLVLKRLGPR
jgi:hypothetical protein